MSADLEEQAVRQEYRVTGDPSWRVLKFWKGTWVVAYFCSSEDGAYQQLEKCVRRQLEWNRLTPDERIKTVLRTENVPAAHVCPKCGRGMAHYRLKGYRCLTCD